MSINNFTLSPPDGIVRRLATGWLILALCSLVGSGLVVLLVVLARTPAIHDLIPWTGSFRTALVIHVDLSVLVWFLSFAGVMACFALPARFTAPAWFGLGAAAVGTIILTLSPFLGPDLPHMNNYVPVLDNRAFFMGFLLLCCGFGLMALHTLINRRPTANGEEKALRFGLDIALIIALLAALSFGWTWFSIPAQWGLDKGEYYYELLFWSSGHILQFTHTQLLLLVWLWLAAAGGGPASLTPTLARILFLLGALPVLASPAIQMAYPVDSIDHRTAFTWLMVYGGGVAALPLGLLAFWSLLRSEQAPETRPQRLALLYSLVLFAIGGGIGAAVVGER